MEKLSSHANETRAVKCPSLDAKSRIEIERHAKDLRLNQLRCRAAQCLGRPALWKTFRLFPSVCVSVQMCASARMCALHGKLIYRAWRREGEQHCSWKASIEQVLLALALALAYLREGGGWAEGQTIQASIQLASHYVAMAAGGL